MAPVLLETAGIPLSPYYLYLMDIKREIPIVAAWGRYYDKNKQCYGIGEGEYSQVIEDYLCVEYNNIMGGRDRVSDFFNPVSQRD